MNILETNINTVLQQIKPKLAPATWESRQFYFNRMLKIAKSLDIDEPCQKLYDAFIIDGIDRGDGCKLHILCVKLLDAESKTKARNENGILYNEPSMPSILETQDYFNNQQYPLTKPTNIALVIVKAEIEMQYLNLTASTMGQYRNSWNNIRRYFCYHGSTQYDRQLLQCYIDDIKIQRNECKMKEWKWKINRKAALVLIEIVDTGQFNWSVAREIIDDISEEVSAIRNQLLVSLKHQNLSESTIYLRKYVFGKLVEFANINNENDLFHLSSEKVQDVILKFADICKNQSMVTILPILRSLLTYLHTSGYVERELSGTVMSGYVQRNSIAAYISEEDQATLITQLNSESKRNKAMILLALKLGLRECDIYNLTFHNIDWRNDKIRINQKKGGEPLVLPLLADVGNALMDYIQYERPVRGDNYPYIFLRAQAPHVKLTSIYMICSKLLREMSIKPINGNRIGIHLFRYTMVHRLLKAKVPHQVITDALGHTSKESDKPYLSMEESMLRMCALDLSVVGKVSWEGGDK